MIPVTKPFLAPYSEISAQIEEVWKREYLTNCGPVEERLVEETRQILGINSYMSFVTNGTIALQLSIRALGLKGEIITTPYSYVATVSSILWENCTPVFVDCNEFGLIDVSRIREKVNQNTCAILATHVYGFPCDVAGIEALSCEYGLKVIYDAAHAFGVRFKKKSIFDYGNISTCSFHATKLFHCVEGGGVFSNSKEIHEKVTLLKTFGHRGDKHISLGINGKQSEIHASIGVINLKYLDTILLRRRQIFRNYYSQLSKKIKFVLPDLENTEWNYSYVPILLENESKVVSLINFLKRREIFVRRYFYPSLNKLSYLSNYSSCPNSESMATRVLCLPTYHGLKPMEQQAVIDAISEWLEKKA